MASTLKWMGIAAAFVYVAGVAHAEESIGVVRRAKGTVEIQRADAKIAMKKGTQLKRGDRIVTGKDGYADITMRGTALSVGPGTDVALNRFAPDDKESAPNARPAIAQGLASLLGMNRHR